MFRAQRLGFRVQGSGFSYFQGSGFRGCRVQGLGLMAFIFLGFMV